MFQVQALKVLVNLSSNPDMMDDIVESQVRGKLNQNLCLISHVFLFVFMQFS